MVRRWLLAVVGISLAVFMASFIYFWATGAEFMTIPYSLLVVGLFWFLWTVFHVVYK